MITKITKQQTYLEKLKAIKAQYEALGYKLDKLIEAESGTLEEKPDAFVTRDQAAKLLKCTVRQIDRLALLNEMMRFYERLFLGDGFLESRL